MKKLVCMVLAGILLFSFCVVTASAKTVEKTAPITVLVNGSPVRLDTPPILMNGHVMVPMRAVLETMGVSVFWDEENCGASVGMTKNDVVYILDGRLCEWGDPEGFDGIHMYVNDQILSLDVPPQLMQNRMLVPLRALAEAFGAEVSWDSKTQTVSIVSNIPEETRLTKADLASIKSFTFEKAMSILSQHGYIGAPTEAYVSYHDGKKDWIAMAFPFGTTQEDVDRYYNGEWDGFAWTDLVISSDGTLTAYPGQSPSK